MMVIYKSILIAAAFTPALAQQATFSSQKSQGAVLNSDIHKFIDGILSEWNSPAGIAVAVVQKDSAGEWSVETKGYGQAKADGTPVDEDTLFAIGSNSKLFDVLATGLLISNTSLSPRISWTTKLASIIPGWELADPVASAETTIVDAMSHRTGLPRHDMMYGRWDSVPSIISRLKYLRASAGFRETWQYNNNMYTALSYLPQLLVGTPYGDYVKQHIFTPLGLSATTYSYDVAKASGHLADGFDREGLNRSEDVFGKGTPRAMEYPGWDLPGGESGNFLSGAGGVIMSAKDAATWLRALLLEGLNPLTNVSVIPAEVIQKAASGVTVSIGVPAYPELSAVVYGGGQSLNTYRGHNLIEHGGAITGFRTQITRLPFDNLGVAVFSNDDTHGSTFHEIIKYRIIDAALGLEPVDWNQRMKAGIIQNTKNSLSSINPRPPHPSPPSIPFPSIAGFYQNPGYVADLELCLVANGTTKATSNTSLTCQAAVEEATLTLPGALNSSVPTFLVKWDRFWVSHLLLRHFDGNLFNATALHSRPTINATKPFWTAVVSEGEMTAEFAFDDGEVGFGATGGVWGAGPGVAGPTGETVKERAEVWFAKI